MVDARGLWVLPGLIDLHTHLREPGHEYKEDIVSGTEAAAAGGFTAVCAMPNTVPPNDCRAVTELIVTRARAAGLVRVYPIGAVTKGQQGEALAEIGEMKDAGIVAVSDDGHPVMSAELLRRGMEYARTFRLPLVQHCEDLALSQGGAMHEGLVSTRAGIHAQPAAAESSMVARDLELCAMTGARYHVAHVSAAASVAAIRAAKRRGLPVTCEVTPHHLTLTDEACAGYDTRAKCNPPLRAAEDLAALRQGIADGTIDAIATDHAPHSSIEKDVEFEQAAFGLLGLETAVPLVLALVRDGVITPARFVELLSAGPAAIFALPGGDLAPGRPADVTVIDPEARWTVVPEHFRSRSRNSPFSRWQVQGKAVMTVVGGKVVFAEKKLLV
jgi:dihydroorotase